MMHHSDIDWRNFDWEKVTINRVDLIDWLISKGSTPVFFADEIQAKKAARKEGGADSTVSTIRTLPVHKPTVPDYLNPDHPRYAPKLAIAIKAWQKVTDPRGKTPLQALREYLESNAKELGLIKDDGKFNREGMEQIAKVANWQPTGGAPKTPG